MRQSRLLLSNNHDPSGSQRRDHPAEPQRADQEGEQARQRGNCPLRWDSQQCPSEGANKRDCGQGDCRSEGGDSNE